jgi:TP53 regulating kinase-like protein
MAFELISQGAEARLFLTTFLGQHVVVKERFKKEYRHPVLDERLTKERLALEARNLVRARRAGVLAPLPFQVDVPRARIVMELIEGVTVKQWLLSDPSVASRDAVASALGAAIARLHAAGLVHGDLTTSNMMLQGAPCAAGVGSAGMRPLPSECVRESNAAFAACVPGGLPYPLILIDFGLSSTNVSTEDKGVDLYVLERALGSTHSAVAEDVMAAVLAAYGSSKEAGAALGKYQAVRLRGRKRMAFG